MTLPPLEKILKLNTKNLLAFYKKKRSIKFSHYIKYTCECCGEFLWDLHPKNHQEAKKEYEALEDYFFAITSELSTREHIPRKK